MDVLEGTKKRKKPSDGSRKRKQPKVEEVQRAGSQSERC
jgi:hypothetical protein